MSDMERHKSVYERLFGMDKDEKVEKVEQVEQSELYDYYKEMMADAHKHILIGTDSVLGTRDNQEDAVIFDCEDDRCMAVLCDGMGGLNKGEVASNTTVSTLLEDYKGTRSIENYPEFFYNEAVKIDNIVHSLTDEQGERLECGSTMVAVAIDGDRLYWLSVGDSRIYIIRNEQIMVVNEEHNYETKLNKLLMAGQIDMEIYSTEMKRGAALTSFIGIGNISLMDINNDPYILEDGDIILLASDGLYRKVSEDIILDVLDNSGADLKLAATRLTSKATELTVKSQDNTTMALILYKK